MHELSLASELIERCKGLAGGLPVAVVRSTVVPAAPAERFIRGTAAR